MQGRLCKARTDATQPRCASKRCIFCFRAGVSCNAICWPATHPNQHCAVTGLHNRSVAMVCSWQRTLCCRLFAVSPACAHARYGPPRLQRTCELKEGSAADAARGAEHRPVADRGVVCGVGRQRRRAAAARGVAGGGAAQHVRRGDGAGSGSGATLLEHCAAACAATMHMADAVRSVLQSRRWHSKELPNVRFPSTCS